MTYNILDFGAKKGTNSTKSIQSAIDKCSSEGGGQVVIPSGTYISGTIWFKDNVELHLESGATLKASTDMDDYNEEDAYMQNWDSVSEKWRAKHLIIALERDNVSISGNGIIDGSGDCFFGEERFFHGGYAWEGGYVTSKDENILRPGQVICFIECSNVKVSDITVKNTPCWGLFLHGCEYAQVRGIKITNPFEYVNTDGIDIDCCRCVTVSDCIISTGDDAIAIRCDSQKLKKPKICENITITNCVLASNSSVFRIGVGVGEIRHIRISNIVVSKGGNLITYATSYYGSGYAKIEDIAFYGISANVLRMIDCVVLKGAIKNAVMKDMYVSARDGVLMVQDDDGIVSDVLLENINLKIGKKVKKDKKCPVNILNAENVVLKNINIECEFDEWEDKFHFEGNVNLIN